MRRKIIYIHPSQLSERWEKYYCLDNLYKKFDIEYWDCSSIAYPSFIVNSPLEREYLVVVNDEASLDYNLRRIPDDSLLVIDLHRNKENLHLFKRISKYFNNRIFINFFSNTLKSYDNKYIAKIKECNISDAIAYFKIKRLFKCYTLSSLRGALYRINHPDYEDYLRNADTPSVIKYPYIVYIDNYFPLHPEVKQREPRLNIIEIIEPFYQSINSFFRTIETKYNCKVVVAAHPSSHYEINPFEGREIIYNQTCNLIKHSRSVCMHSSNSLSFVMLYNKPLALLSNNAYQKAIIEEKRIISISKLTGVEITDTDKALNKEPFQKIAPDISQLYKSKYLIAEENTQNEKLFETYFNKICEEM